MQNNNFIYTEEQLMARLRFFIGACLALTLTGIVFVVLYSLIFVTQPLNAISPIDQKFFELIVPIATFLTGTLSGIMLAGGDKDNQSKALEAANKGWDKPPTSPQPNSLPIMNSNFASSQITPTSNSFGNSFMNRQEPSFNFPVKTDVPFTSNEVLTGFGGKPAPVQPSHPEI